MHGHTQSDPYIHTHTVTAITNTYTQKIFLESTLVELCKIWMAVTDTNHAHWYSYPYWHTHSDTHTYMHTNTDKLTQAVIPTLIHTYNNTHIHTHFTDTNTHLYSHWNSLKFTLTLTHTLMLKRSFQGKYSRAHSHWHLHCNSHTLTFKPTLTPTLTLAHLNRLLEAPLEEIQKPPCDSMEALLGCFMNNREASWSTSRGPSQRSTPKWSFVKLL